MPLSDEEARMLAQLEASLAAEDPELASALRGSAMVARARRLVAVAGLAFVLGVGLLLGGAVADTWPLGVLGFVVMVASAYWFSTLWRRSSLGRSEPRSTTPRSPKSSSSFVDRMEERWNRRQDEGF